MEGGLVRPAGEVILPGAADRPELDRAESLFSAGDIAAATPLYEDLARSAADRGTQGYAHYKLAWCRFNLRDLEGAVNAMVDLLALVDTPRTDQERSLRREAAKDLVLFYATWPAARADRAEAFLARVLPEAELDDALGRLAQIYDSNGRLRDAQAIRATLQSRRAP